VLLGVHLTRFVGTAEPAPIATTLATFAERVEDIGVHSVWPMDQLRQIPVFGEPEDPVLEPYSMLSWLAARTQCIQLGVLATAGSYRHPAVLAKTISTLDVLSGGRAWLGLGAAWGDDAASTAERYDRLEELLHICNGYFRGEPINAPMPLRHPPVLIAGSGEHRTLPLVAKYADACNFLERIGIDEIVRKLDVLARHCAEAGRDYGDILKTTFGRLGERDLAGAVDRFAALADAGIDLAMVDVPDPTDESAYDHLAGLVDALAPLGRRLPTRLQQLTTCS
jgi:alkanesulfonate monooxygenase SsuD/methylene tetrahydromethanopterin reductase-like flavin-dependent oxidoreductase (luciferase family)